jgi:hypothetical protein
MKCLLVLLFAPLMLVAELETAGFIFNRYPPLFLSKSPHWLVEVKQIDNGDYLLQLEDGSWWRISNYDGNYALTWKENDPLTLTQNHRWRSSYDYLLVNQVSNSHVEANLQGEPQKDGPYTRTISQLSADHKEIQLSDHTRWEISSLDTSVAENWDASHTVIIGSNSDWDSTCEGMIVNVTLKTCVRAKQL